MAAIRPQNIYLAQRGMNCHGFQAVYIRAVPFYSQIKICCRASLSELKLNIAFFIAACGHYSMLCFTMNPQKSFFENEVHRKDQKHKSNQVIYPEGFVFKNKEGKDRKDDQSDHFLDDF